MPHLADPTRQENCFSHQRKAAPTRAFLVGCPRTGTTLLQSLLAAHPDLVSFPETHYFLRVVPRERWRRVLGVASPHGPDALAQLTALGITQGAPDDLPRGLLTLRQYVRRLTAILDSAAARAGATHWLEKTPDHLAYIREIERYVRRPRIIHMLRDGQAVVASLFAARQEHPEWGGPATLEAVIEQWRASLQRSLSCIGRPNHTFVSYERLVMDPHSVLFRLCESLGLPASNGRIDQMVRDHASQHHRLVGYTHRTPAGYVIAQEPWKRSVAAPIRNRNRQKFLALFDLDDRQRIDRAVAEENRAHAAIPFV